MDQKKNGVRRSALIPVFQIHDRWTTVAAVRQADKSTKVLGHV